MSMHLASPGLTTTSTKKRKNKVTKAQQDELERGWRDRNVRLRQMGLQKETFEQYLVWVYGKGKKNKKEENNWTKSPQATAKAPPKVPHSDSRSISESNPSTHDHNPKSSNLTHTHGKLWITGACASKPSPTYTGTKIIGIGTMHKSNAVPIFSDDEAKDISSMRR